ISLRELLLVIRKKFDQYVNLRPIKLLNNVQSSLQNGSPENINMVYVRENSEGEYSGKGDRIFEGTLDETALQTGVFSRKGTKRIIQYAFELAKQQNKSLTTVSKANA